VSQFVAWVKANYPDFCVQAATTENPESQQEEEEEEEENQDIDLARIASTTENPALMKELYSHAFRKKDEVGNYLNPAVYLSYENVGSYKSALISHFKSKRIKFSDASTSAQAEFYASYRPKSKGGALPDKFFCIPIYG